MEKKVLMKIRLRTDGTWEHVYEDGSVDQEFAELTPKVFAKLYSNKSEMIDTSNANFEQLVEDSGFFEANAILNKIRAK